MPPSVVRLGASKDSYPYSFVDNDGVHKGFAVDLTAALGRTMHLRMETHLGTISEIQEQLSNGQLDVLQSYASSPQREVEMDFSVPYLDMTGTMIVRKGAREIQSAADLKGRKVLVHPKSLGETYLINHGLRDSILSCNSVAESLQRLNAGEGDAALATRLTAMTTIHMLGLKHLELRGESLDGFRVRYCYAVRRGHSHLLAKLNEGLAVLHATGEFDRIYDKWFGKVDPKGYTGTEIGFAISGGLVIALIVALVAAVCQRRLIKQVQDSEALYRGLFEKSPEGLVVLMPDVSLPPRYVVQQLNPEAQRLFGHAEGAAFSGALADLLGGEPGLLAKMEACLGTGEADVFDHDRSHGECISLWRVAVVRIGERVLMVISDLSEAKAAEERLHRSELQLRQTQKLEAIGTLSSGIAHDFNNILTGIIGNAELVLMDADNRGAVQEGISEVLRAAERARLLVKQILTFSRKAEAKRELVDVSLLATEALRFVRAASPASIELLHHSEADLPKIEADPTQLHQVLMNLCTNSVHAMAGGNGILEITEEAVDVDADMAILYPGLKDGPHVRISVRDNGCGMEESVVQRIFEPFFTTRRLGEGTGLGLSVVHGIVRAHGGAITVYSQPGQGTVFRLYFPVARNSEEGSRAELAHAFAQGDGERVLLVDDEVSITRVVSVMLRRLGYKVTTYNAPRDALEAFVKNPEGWDLVLSDLTMPRMSGLEFAEQIFARRPGMAFVLMSGFVGEDVMARAGALCIREVLDKPVALLSLGRSLSRALNGGR